MAPKANQEAPKTLLELGWRRKLSLESLLVLIGPAGIFKIIVLLQLLSMFFEKHPKMI